MLMCAGSMQLHTAMCMHRERVVLFPSLQICFNWLQGTGGVSIYGAKFEDESFDCMSLFVLDQ